MEKIEFAALAQSVKEDIEKFQDGRAGYYRVWSKFIENYQAGLMSIRELEIAILALQDAKNDIIGEKIGW